MRRAATREYRMGDRAAEMERRRRRILDAAVEIADPRVPLSAIAKRAGVSERTILRHFGSRSGLTAAALEHGEEMVREERFSVEPGDVDSAARTLVRHYEQMGDSVIGRLAEEGAHPDIDAMLERGRRMHREWVERCFGPQLRRFDRSTRRRRTAQLVAACDVYTWKLMRRDSGLGLKETERAIAELIRGLIGGDHP